MKNHHTSVCKTFVSLLLICMISPVKMFLIHQQSKTVLLSGSTNICGNKNVYNVLYSSVSKNVDIPSDESVSNNEENIDIDSEESVFFQSKDDKWIKIRESKIEERAIQLRNLIYSILCTKNPDHIPSLLTKNIDFVLSLGGTANDENDAYKTVQKVLNNKGEKLNNYSNEIIEETIDLILSFAEDFVEYAFDIDDHNKKLLGKIIRNMAQGGNKGKTEEEEKGGEKISAKDYVPENKRERREDLLDELIKNEKINFTPGFLRHLENECNRIYNAPKKTNESKQLLQIMRIIQTRVLEELGKDLGEGAVVLGQLIAYDSDIERLAVLDAGLTVRGIEFAKELVSLTEEALNGFDSKPDVDPDLVQRVKQIHDHVQKIIFSP